MSNLRKAAADALEALERFHQDGYNREDCSAAIDALRAALAQEAGPVAELRADAKGGGYIFWMSDDYFEPGTKLYTAPPAAVPAQKAEPVARCAQLVDGEPLWVDPDLCRNGIPLYLAPPAAPAVSDVELIALLREARDVISDIDEESHNPPTVKYARDVNCRIEAALAAKEE